MTFKITSLDETNGYIAEYSLDKKLYVDYKGLKLGPIFETRIFEQAIRRNELQTISPFKKKAIITGTLMKRGK